MDLLLAAVFLDSLVILTPVHSFGLPSPSNLRRLVEMLVASHVANHIALVDFDFC